MGVIQDQPSPSGNRPDGPGDPLIIQRTICLLPSPLCRHDWGRGRVERRLERMSDPVLIRAGTEPPGPGVGGQQAPGGPLGHTHNN